MKLRNSMLITLAVIFIFAGCNQSMIFEADTALEDQSVSRAAGSNYPIWDPQRVYYAETKVSWVLDRRRLRGKLVDSGE